MKWTKSAINGGVPLLKAGEAKATPRPPVSAASASRDMREGFEARHITTVLHKLAANVNELCEYVKIRRIQTL